MERKQWLTVAQIAERLQVHPETVRRWLRDGQLAGRNFGGKSGYRVRESDLEAFLSEDPAEGKAVA
ncbi:MAG TPA: helix-turn-helix domain-containing protein [Thermomicrobiales bacterium]|nr:helix-turn-helix domain-containing protein [Thermomicrobiales bacterium]